MVPNTSGDEVFVLRDQEFEWDIDKARTNLRDHDVSFQLAATVFFDPCRIGDIDDREEYGEDRFWTVGMVAASQWCLLRVNYTENGDRIRIISAWKAERDERRQYQEEPR